MGALEKGGFFKSDKIGAAYPMSNAAIQLGVESIVYFFLFFYLDQVFPNEYGVAKHPLFFLEGIFFNTKNHSTESLLQNDNFNNE